MKGEVPPGTIQALLFDLDGTLLDSYEQHGQAMAAALRDFGFAAPPATTMRRLMGLPGVETLLKLGVPAEQVHGVWLHWAEWEGRMAHLAQPFPGSVGLLKRLRAAGYCLGIVTSRPRESFDLTPAARDLVPHVDVVVTRDDTADGKPNPAPVLHALQYLGIDPARGCYVGDSCYDIEAGNRAGCLTVFVGWEDSGKPGLYRPDYTVASLDELSTLLLE